MTADLTVTESGQTLGQSLCAAHDLDFAKVFCHQFRVSSLPRARLPGFQRIVVGKWLVDVGCNLPFCSATANDGAEFVVFGIAVSSTGAVIDAQALANLPGAEAGIDLLNNCAGRFAFLVTARMFDRIYVDPMGSLGTLYDIIGKCVASTLNLVLARQPVFNDDYPLTDLANAGKARFAFGHTPDKYVKRVLPNHYLDLTSLEVHRFWPAQGAVIDAPPHDEINLVQRIADRLVQVIDSLTKLFPETKFALSGGIDSRVLLACAKPSIDRLALYSHAENMMSRRDTRIARQLARKLGKQLDVYDPTRNERYQINDDGELARLSKAASIATGDYNLTVPTSKLRHEVLSAVPQGGLVLRGNGGEILSAMLWRRGVREFQNGLAHNVQTGLRMLMLAEKDAVDKLEDQQKQFIENAYKTWFSALEGTAAKKPFDFLYVEQFLAHRPGNEFYGFTRNFYVFPFCDRTILGIIMSLAPDRRATLRFTEAIISTRAEELRDVRYTANGVTAQLAAKREINPTWYEQV